MKRVVIISGGTTNYIATHLALCAPAYGATGRTLVKLCEERWNPQGPTRLDDDLQPCSPCAKHTADIDLRETKMANSKSPIETNFDVERLVDDLVDDLNVKVIFMPVALCDFAPYQYSRWAGENSWEFVDTKVTGRNGQRLKTNNGTHALTMNPAPKLIPKIRAKRKDIFLVGFKTTDGVDEQEQYLAGLRLLKEASCNLVLANDVKTRLNMIITPEEAKYHVSKDRDLVLRNLVEMAYLRSHLTFTRSTVVAGEPVPWESELVPPALRTVVNHCIEKGAYKPFRGATVGHFACKLPDITCNECDGSGRDGLTHACSKCHGYKTRGVFLTSRRKTNFNDLPKLGLVRIETDGPDTVLAYGSKPSVGGQSQRIIFSEHPEYDCIVHFHCPLKPCMGCHRKDWACGCNRTLGRTTIPTVSQREYECGSHQCGENTSRGLKRFGNLACVFLDQHGPNIVFHHSIDPQEVIDFIETNFDLSQKTGGPV